MIRILTGLWLRGRVHTTQSSLYYVSISKVPARHLRARLQRRLLVLRLPRLPARPSSTHHEHAGTYFETQPTNPTVTPDPDLAVSTQDIFRILRPLEEAGAMSKRASSHPLAQYLDSKNASLDIRVAAEQQCLDDCGGAEGAPESPSCPMLKRPKIR